MSAARASACRVGFGTIEAMEDQEQLAQLRRLAKTARYLTSVCTGTLVLGAAGLLKGKRATSLWAWRDALSAFGATPDSGEWDETATYSLAGASQRRSTLRFTVLAEVAAYEFRTRLAALGIRQSMNRPGEPTDNAHMESFFHSLKTERLARLHLRHRCRARRALRGYIAFYNQRRLHSALNYRSPADYERAAA